MKDTLRPVNVPEPADFCNQLGQMFSTTHALIDLLREKTLSSHSEDGCQLFDPDSGTCVFQAAGQFERPQQFLQTLLDLVRIIFEPTPHGTLLLNSNIGFVLGEIVNTHFRLGYLSAIRTPGESASEFHRRVIAPQTLALGYGDVIPHAVFLMVSAATIHPSAPDLRVPDIALGQRTRQEFLVNLLHQRNSPKR